MTKKMEEIPVGKEWSLKIPPFLFQDKLEKELTSLRTQVDHQLDGYVYINENNHLKNEVNRLATANCLANIQANEKRVCMLEAKYNELKNEMDKESDGKLLFCACRKKNYIRPRVRTDLKSP